MKSTIIAYTNPKGQVVIPKKYRDALKINEDVPLAFTMAGKAIFISPVKSVLTEVETDNSYLSVLERTKGAWGPETSSHKKMSKERREKELKASKERKTW